MTTPQNHTTPGTARKSARKRATKAGRQGRNDTELLLASPENASRLRAAIKQANALHPIGKTALENSGLPIEFVRELLISKHTDRALAEPFPLKTARKSARVARTARKSA